MEYIGVFAYSWACCIQPHAIACRITAKNIKAARLKINEYRDLRGYDQGEAAVYSSAARLSNLDEMIAEARVMMTE